MGSSDRKTKKKHRKSRANDNTSPSFYSSSEEGNDRIQKKKRDRKKKKHRKSSKHSVSSEEDGTTSRNSSSSSEEVHDAIHGRKRDKDSQRSHSKSAKRFHTRHRESKRREKNHRKNKGRGKDKHQDSPHASEREMGLPSAEEVVSTILRKFPQVLEDLKQLLEMIDDGQAVDIGGLANKHVALYLQELFRALHLHCTPTGLFFLPNDASNKTLDILSSVLEAHSTVPAAEMEPFNESRETPTHRSREDTSGLIMGSSDRKEHTSAIDDAIGLKRRMIGPSMPSEEMLAAAARLTEAGAVLRAAEEDLEHLPIIGPPPPAAVAEAEFANEAERFEEVERIVARDIENAYEVLNLKAGVTSEMLKKRYWKLSLLVHPDKCSHPRAHEAFTELNQAFKELQDPVKRSIIDKQIEEKATREEFEADMKAKKEAAQWRKLRGEALPGDDALLNPPKAPTRDEWMTQLPPERQAGPPSMHSTFFSKSEKSGRGDTSVWTDTPLEKAQKAKAQYLEAYKQATLAGSSEESLSQTEHSHQTAEMMDQFNSAKRRTSLLDKYHAEHSKKSKKSTSKEPSPQPEWLGKHPWSPWDRERDLVAGRKNVEFDKDRMSEGLLSRFSSSHRERSFL